MESIQINIYIYINHSQYPQQQLQVLEIFSELTQGMTSMMFYQGKPGSLNRMKFDQRQIRSKAKRKNNNARSQIKTNQPQQKDQYPCWDYQIRLTKSQGCSKLPNQNISNFQSIKRQQNKKEPSSIKTQCSQRSQKSCSKYNLDSYQRSNLKQYQNSQLEILSPQNQQTYLNRQSQAQYPLKKTNTGSNYETNLLKKKTSETSFQNFDQLISQAKIAESRFDQYQNQTNVIEQQYQINLNLINLLRRQTIRQTYDCDFNVAKSGTRQQMQMYTYY